MWDKHHRFNYFPCVIRNPIHFNEHLDEQLDDCLNEHLDEHLLKPTWFCRISWSFSFLATLSSWERYCRVSLGLKMHLSAGSRLAATEEKKPPRKSHEKKSHKKATFQCQPPDRGLLHQCCCHCLSWRHPVAEERVVLRKDLEGNL